MKIAILAHVRQRIAQPFAGGMEAHCWELAEGLQNRGHEVVLFASGDSDPRFTIDPVINEHYEVTYPWAEHRGSLPLVAHLDAGYAASCDRIAEGNFDVVHNNSLHRFPLEQRRTAVVPTVTSLHVPPYDALHGFVTQSPSAQHLLTVTSTSQLTAWWPNGAPPQASVLHNGIAIERWPFVHCGNGEAVWCGRITPNKGPHLAARAAQAAGIGLTLFGVIEDLDYWHAEVAPLIGSTVAYGGHLDAEALAVELGRASVFIFTPCWDEPFGLAAAEAMACGLPVAAFDMGAAREVIGEAGAFSTAGDIMGLAAAIDMAMGISRTVPRDRVARLFTRDRWLDRCVALYSKVAADTAAVPLD